MNKTILNSIITFIDTEELIPEGSTIVLGLSGGPDSVFLFQLLLELKQVGKIENFVAAHLDHEWRPNSHKDTEFCAQLAQKHGIPFETAKLSDLEADFKWDGSKEEIGRKARRFFLEFVAQKYTAEAIALGQHAQDQQETFLIRLVRGASLTGLCGIWPKRGIYIRPLLQTNKSEILNYLNAHNIAYLEDPSNLQDTFLRNRIRKNVIPALKNADDRFDTNFTHTIDRLQQTEQYLDAHARDLFAQMSTKENSLLEVSLSEFLSYPPIMQSRLLILWLTLERVPFPPSQTFIDEVMRFLRSDRGGTHALHEKWSMKKKSGTAWIEKNCFPLRSP